MNDQYGDRLDEPGRLGDTDYVLEVRDDVDVVRWPLWWQVAIDEDNFTVIRWFSAQSPREVVGIIESLSGVKPGQVVSTYRIARVSDGKRATVAVVYDPVSQVGDMHEPPAYSGELDYGNDGSELVHPYID